MITKLINRLKEPSTYAGLSGATLLGLGWTPDEFKVWIGAVAGLFAFLSIIMKEIGAES